jgi:tetratricopeptide (TPR) repeat protein
MPRPTRRAVAALGVLLLGATGVTAYLYRGADPGKDLAAAREAADRRDFKVAGTHVDRYLAARPDDLDARLFASQLARRRNEAGEFFAHLKAHRQQGGPEAGREFELRCFQVQEGDLADAERLLRDAAAKPSAPECPLAVEAVILGTLKQLKSRSGQMWKLPAGPADPRVALARKATDLWAEARTNRADRVQGLVWRGRVRAAAGEYAEAVADYRAALADDPDHADAHFHLAATVLQADPATALEHLRPLRESRADDPEVQSALGAAYRALGRLEEARAVLAEANSRRPDELVIVFELGLVELDAGRLALAEAWLRQVLARAPNDPGVNLAMSRCMALAGKAAEAKQFHDRHEELEIAAKRPWRMPHKP